MDSNHEDTDKTPQPNLRVLAIGALVGFGALTALLVAVILYVL